ncbi:hypothetical protein FBU30_007060 [Linnemannia zychae]|nr:hypothetical protein FBU30_007060 [Linnemannia zychae]
MDPQEKLEAMFCPRLDSALVASIYHDLGDFKACIPILSALAADTPGGGSTVDKPTSPVKTHGLNQSNNTDKKSNTASSNKNILIWSEEVANSNSSATTSSTAHSGLFKSNKQGQITNSSSFQQPTTLVNSPTPLSTQSMPVKSSYKAVRNPRYMQKHVVMEPSAETVDVDDEEQAYDAESPEDNSAKEENDDVTYAGNQEALDVNENIQSTDQGLKKKKKNRRLKKSERAAKAEPAFEAIQTRGTWRQDVKANNIDSWKSDNTNEADYEDKDYRPLLTSKDDNCGISEIKVEELDFLRSCFPDREYSDEYLTQVLEDCHRDLEAAVEMILSQMFLENEQVEISSTGSGSATSGLTASSTTTSSMDDAFFDGVQNEKSSKKKKWGAVSTGGSDGVAAWGAVRHQPIQHGHNDQLLKAIDFQDEFLIPESNEWATFDHQISILMNIFHTVPKKTIVSEYHGNGTNLFRTVEAIENRLKQESRSGPQAALGRERQTRFDINLAQLMEMFPEHSAVGLKKMLVYNGGNIQDAMNAVLAADFARADMSDRPTYSGISKRGNMVPFQADIKFADKNVVPNPTSSGNRLKSLPSSSNPFPDGPRPFPNTIVDNANADLYNDDDDPFWCRQQAGALLNQRNELFRKAAKAYQASKGKGAGMGGIAAYYADEGKKLDAQGKQWHMRAARAVVQQHRLANNDPNLVDLHGLTVSEAQVVVREAVTQWFSRSTMQASRIAGKPLKIICGVGSHSKDRIARLYPTILSLLQKDGWRCEADRGVILVKGVSRIMPSKK